MYEISNQVMIDVPVDQVWNVLTTSTGSPSGTR
jgi:hypothetical protein